MTDGARREARIGHPIVQAPTGRVSMNLEELRSTKLDSTVKGMPERGGRSISLAEIATMRWNLLAGDLPFPVATLSLDRLRGNSQWMRSFTERHGIRLCPHGKTTMAPQLFQLQLEDGAWGITVASTQQMQVCRRFGVKRILMANQLVGDLEIRSVFRALKDDADLDFYCLVDSLENVWELQRVARDFALRRPIQVLLEIGLAAGRTGVREFDEAVSLARLISECHPYLALSGVEGFEGVVARPDHAQAESDVREYVGRLSDVFERLENQRLFTVDKPMLTIGGSIYFDLVATHPRIHALRRRCEVILRSGCYLTHDSVMLTNNFKRVLARTAGLGAPSDAPRPALSVWGRIQSMPEPGLAILNVGKRDVSFDVDLPVAETWFRSGAHATPIRIAEPVTTVQINDQHTFFRVPANTELRVGDVVGLGISHPCTTFDKWKLLYIVDETYDVVEGILTYF